MENKYKNTYCNPIPLPSYPLGKHCVESRNNYLCDYREAADPTVIYEDSKWYLYPSCGMAYYTEDFISWKHARLDPYTVGYAPTVVKNKDRFFLIASESDLYEANNPLGPFKSLGPIKDINGNAPNILDPMLFTDDDDRLYLYYGCGGEIKGAELDVNNPTRMITESATMFAMNTSEHIWERMGDFNADDSYSWVEGSWMYKRNGTYYLTYSAPGTEWITYAMGAYKSASPLGPWEYMKTSPFLLTKHGLVTGTGHGSIVDGPNGNTYVFYTCNVGYGGKYERRIGFDLLDFDENGDIIPTSATETPNFAPGVSIKGSAELMPLTQRQPTTASSYIEGRDELYATDGSMLTWWQPENSDTSPTLTVFLSSKPMEIASARVIWRDVGLNIKENILPEPVSYIIEAKNENDEWICVLDKSNNQEDMLINYDILTPVKATEVRIKITSKPKHIKHGLVNFTIFGQKK